MPNFDENLLISAARIDGLILDVDGVITNGQMIYDQNGKKYKIFGQDDHDSMKLMKKYIKIFFYPFSSIQRRNKFNFKTHVFNSFI